MSSDTATLLIKVGRSSRPDRSHMLQLLKHSLGVLRRDRTCCRSRRRCSAGRMRVCLWLLNGGYVMSLPVSFSVPAAGRPRASGAAEVQAGRRRRRRKHLLPELRETLQRRGAARAEQALPPQMLRLQR